MTREEAIESGIRAAWRHFVEIDDEEYDSPVWAARDLLSEVYPDEWRPDELEGFAVGLQLIAVEVAEIARKRQAAAAGGFATEKCGAHGPRYVCPDCDVSPDATSETSGST